MFELNYRIRPNTPESHLFAVEILLPPLESAVVLAMPAWIPGSYMIRDFARHVVNISAIDHQDRSIALHKSDKQTWRIDQGATVRAIRYRVYAGDLSVRGCHLDSTHGYFNGAALLLQVAGFEQHPCTVELLAPESLTHADWRVATSLAPVAIDSRGFGRYRADDYADLIDHPVEMGRFDQLEFEVQGIAHRMAITGRQQADMDGLKHDLTRICEQHAALFGALPIDRYLFLTTVVGEGYGGLEHRFSSSLICARDDIHRTAENTPESGYVRFLGLCSHEYFHLWNVKRIRPQVFIDGGLERETHTRLLWAFEGITSYYDELALARAGCIDAKTYLGLLAKAITRLLRAPGRRLQTLAESSFDAWTRFYKQDENAPNAIVSYYGKGALVALALDLTIRAKTGGARSLDDLMRALWRAHGETGLGVPERGIETLASQICDCDLQDFFDRALDSLEDPDLSSLLASVGVAMRLRPARDSKDLGGCVECFEPIPPASPTLGIRLRPGNDAIVQNVFTDGAGERAGLAPGDHILAFDGVRATADNLDRLVARAGTSSGRSIHLFRRDELLTLTAAPEPTPLDTCELMLDPQADESLLKARAAWLASLV